MRVPQLLAMTLALAPSFAAAALYPPDSLVKMIDAKGFRTAMKANQTSVVAFVASWCGHCQRMVPEYSKAALGLYPLIPVYAVDCDENRGLCAEQGVKGFPTVKLFPRGKTVAPVTFDAPDRTASAFYYWATRRVPNRNTKLYKFENIEPWVTKNIGKTRILLLSKSKNVPLLWQVLANKYRDDFEFASHRDRKGRTSVKLGYEPGEKKDSKILVYTSGSSTPFLFEGILKLDSISKFFDSVLDGTADLTVANEQAKEEEFTLSEEELEIERKQEAQRLALAHGGFSDMIDFEEAVKKYGADFHEKQGFGGMMGDMPRKKAKEEEPAAEKEEDPIHKILRVQKEKAEKAEKEARRKKKMPKTDEAGQIVMEAPTDTEMPNTATATAQPTPTEAPATEAADSDDTPAVESLVADTPAEDPLDAPADAPADEQAADHGAEHASAESHVKDEL
ncbi:hypothetical protein BV25DRAFT_1809975 [Artomyces pyxidatus]|uniref:Uncharacterized protein n=1 Tax=Artomyces pyxidatus TaxID=48021 RepID=A0ACB8SRL4_9AGAM|nr:hypothetical protein BV25DRAFT_1809975 [Artomyces pyxidatus]